MKIRKWRLEHHPTVKSIPIAIVLNWEEGEYVPLLRNSYFYTEAKSLVDEHNDLVDKVEALEQKVEHLLYEMT